MESRLRKFLSSRRLKPQHDTSTSELDLHSVPYTTTPPRPRLPVLVHHARGKSSQRTEREAHEATDLPALSYQSTVPGKPPQVGDRPQRGNGPVKLQTSRRLSSGELLVTHQDYDRTLEDIRQGDYIVGGKDRRISQAPSQRNSSVRGRVPESKSSSTSPNFARPSLAFNPGWTPPLATGDYTGSRQYHSPSSTSASLTPNQHISSDYGYPHRGWNQHYNGLGISTQPGQFYSRHMSSTTSLHEPLDGQNATVQALWKAEHTRLSSIYGESEMDRDSVQPHQVHRSTSNAFLQHRLSAARDTAYSSSVSLQQPLRPHRESAGRELGVRNHVSMSNLGLGYLEEHSDGSSNQRHSLLSSSGRSSSFTTRTSMAEDLTTTRDDVRRIVDDMRMNYLHALEAHTPPLHPISDPPLRKPRSRKQTRSLASSVSVESGLRSINRQSHSKSWQSTTTYMATPRTSTSSPPTKPQSRRTSLGPSRRTSVQPVAGIAPLSPIKASPARPIGESLKDDNIGLKRADSTTLGSLAKGLKILDNRASNTSSHPTSASSPTFYDSSSSESTSEFHRTSPSLPVRQWPPKTPPARPTPGKITSVGSNEAPAKIPPWYREADRLFVDADLDVALDIDGFESLCDDSFSTPAFEGGQLGTLQSWVGESRGVSNMPKPDGITTGSPSRRSRLGLGIFQAKA